MATSSRNDSNNSPSSPLGATRHVWRARPFFADQGIGKASNAGYLAFDQVRQLEPLPPLETDADLRTRLLTLLEEEAAEDLFGSLAEAYARARRPSYEAHARRLITESSRQVQDLWMLHDAALRIGESLAPVETARILLEATLDLTATDVAWLTTFSGDVWLMEANSRLDPPTSGRGKLLERLPICRAAARSNQPIQTSDLPNDHRWLQDRSATDLARTEELTSAVALPAGSPHEGNLWVLAAASKSSIRLDPWASAILNAIATHAARAIVTADSLQTYRADLRAAREQNQELEAKHRVLAQVADVETELLRFAATGMPVVELAATVATQLDSHVIVTDEDLNILVDVESGDSECSIADRDALIDALSELGPGEVAHSKGLQAWLTASPRSSQAQLKVSVRPTADIGYSAEVFPSLLTQINSVMALAAVTKQLYEKAHNRSEQEIVSSLLGESEAAAAAQRDACASRGLTLDGPLGLAVVHLGRRPDSETVDVALSAMRPFQSIVGHEKDTLVALTHPDSLESATEALHQRIAKHSSTPVTAAFAVSSGGPSSLADAFARAFNCIRLMIGLRLAGTVGSESAVQPYAVLLGETGAEQAARYIDERIKPLVDYDDLRQAELVKTLLVYLDSGHNTAEASAALHIHPNTLRQRLERVDALLANWRDPTQTLQVHLALRLYTLRNELEVN